VGKEASFTIDYMTKQDIDQVMAIEQSSFSMPWSRNLFLSEFRSPAVSLLLVALAESPIRTVIGYIVCWVVTDELHILNLAVAEGDRRRGIGRKLVLAAIERGSRKGAQKAHLEVRSSNSAAQKLYSDIGFTGSGVRRDYYDSPPEDAVIMTLDDSSFESVKNSLLIR
jgi:ribosomal-protein-alanine N-acetyltransferase